MNTHFYTTATLDHPRQLVEGTPQWPANSGQYEITMGDGSVRREWYTVALGWNDGKLNTHDIVSSKFIMSYPAI